MQLNDIGRDDAVSRKWYGGSELADKLLSIIVPVYNVEGYLQECIESMIQTDMEQVEIILVDDGSKDSSGEICDELSERYLCVRCIHKENEGVSRTRNIGLNEAKGRYIAFVDADDRLAKGSVSAALQWTVDADADICFMQAIKFYPDGVKTDLGDKITREGVCGKEKADVFRYLCTRPKYPGSACTKLFKRDFLTENNLIFPAGRTHGEDLTFVLECLLVANVFDVLDIPYYEYRQVRLGSASHTVTEKAFWQLSMFVSRFSSRLIRNNKAVDEIAGYAMSFVAYEYMVLLLWYESLRKKNGSEGSVLRKYLKEQRWVMKYAKSRVGTLGYCCMNILGFDLTAWLIGIIKGNNM